MAGGQEAEGSMATESVARFEVVGGRAISYLLFDMKMRATEPATRGLYGALKGSVLKDSGKPPVLWKAVG